MDDLNVYIGQLIEEHGVNLSKEGVVFSFNDGYISLYLEDDTLKVDVHFTDRVININKNLNDVVGLVQ